RAGRRGRGDHRHRRLRHRGSRRDVPRGLPRAQPRGLTLPAMRPWLVTTFSAFVNTFFHGLLLTFGRLEVVGRERLPEGASLMIANHLHLLDPPLVMS